VCISERRISALTLDVIDGSKALAIASFESQRTW
jgi:hypothetical protein